MSSFLAASVTYILHEFAADRPDVLAQCGAEHHDLLLMRRDPEDLLHVTPHVCHTGGTKEQR